MARKKDSPASQPAARKQKEPETQAPARAQKPRAKAASKPKAPEAALVTAELDILKRVVESQQLELENRRALLEQVEWRERLLAEEVELLRTRQQDLADLRREAAEARAQVAEAVAQRELARAHAQDVEQRLQAQLLVSQELEARCQSQEQTLRKLEKTLGDRAEELAELAALVEEADAREDQLRADHARELKRLQEELARRPSPELEEGRAGDVLAELRAAEARAQAAHQEMVAMRTRMLEAHNQLELAEMARQRAEQRVSQLEEQLRGASRQS